MKFLQNQKHFQIFAYLLIFIAGFAIYAKTMGYKLTYLDDKDFVKVCAQAYETKSFSDVFTNDVLFSLNITGYYRPVLSLSFMIDNTIAGDSVKFAHVTNILLHCFCSLILFFFLRRYIIKEQNVLSFLFAFLFAVHPAVSYTAAWIPGRNDSLFLLSFVLSLIFFIEYLNNRKIYWLLPHLFFMFAAYFTKESGIIIPFLIAAYRFTKIKDIKHSYADAVLYLIYAASILAFLYIRNLIIPNSSLSLSLLKTIFAKDNLAMLFDYFYSIVFLQNSFAANQNAEIFIFGGVSIAFTAFAAFYKKPKEEILRQAFYFVLPVIFIGITFFSGRLHSHGNRIYIPLFFTLVIFSSFAQALVQNGKENVKTVFICVIVLIFAAASQTLKIQRHFNGLNFFDTVIAQSDYPSNAIYKLRALYLIDEGYIREALNDAVFMSYLSNFQDNEILYILSYAFLLNGDLKNAQKYCEKLILQNPDAPMPAWGILLISSNLLGDKEKENEYSPRFCQKFNLTPRQYSQYLNEAWDYFRAKKAKEINIIQNDSRSRLNLKSSYLN